MRILIAGLGAIGQRHARNLRALLGRDLELLAFRQRRLPFIVTERLERDDARTVEAELGVRAYVDLDEALAMRPNAVFVCTPSSQHLEIAQRAASAGCHLFIEKPLSHTLDGLDALRSTIASRGLVALLGCQWRYHPTVRWLRRTLDAGEFGRVARARIEYAEYLPDWHPYEDYRASYAAREALGGGVVLTQIHDYDLAWWLFGAPTVVTASGGHLSDLEIDVEDTVEAQLNGGPTPVLIRQSFASRPPRRAITLETDRGSVTADLLAARVLGGDGLPSPPWRAEYRRNDMFLDEARHFLACLSGAASPEVSLDDGIAVLRLAVAVKVSMRSGRPVEVP
ncbi:MAG TPA: Gfo/Idh/MocA family oxidoreductase [Vicinamibacterales bacterium]